MDILRYTLLYDFYGELLTEKQKQIFELYYLNDLSLTEIGQELEISRQAVRDQIKRTEKILIGYEQKLGLVERFLAHKEALKEVDALILQIEEKTDLNEEIASIIVEIKRITSDIID